MTLARLFLVLLCAVPAVPACRKSNPPPAAAQPASDAHIMKLWVTKDGVIELDGKVVEIGAVDEALAALAKREGVVFYGREAAREAPHPNGAKLVEMIAARRLPVRLSSKPDFSDAIGPSQ